MRTPRKTHAQMVDLLFTLALFCVFAASSLMVVIIGANVYKGTVSSMNGNFNLRTSLSYVAQKVRQNDLMGGVRLEQFGEGNALVLEQELEGETYQTWIYYDSGAIRELFVAEGADMSPADGEEIMRAGGFTAEQAGESLYRFTVTDESGKSAQIAVSPRCG